MNDTQPTAIVIGAGPAGLMASDVLSRNDIAVTVYDRMPSIGRKFLMAGRGGLNLTHSEPLPVFLARYRNAASPLIAAIEAFPPEALRTFSAELGQPTFVGSSGRVFPQAMKASPLLRAWLHRLATQGVNFTLRRHWIGWSDDKLAFVGPDGHSLVDADVVIFALGGGSWPKLGSDGGWAEPFAQQGIALTPLQPANCGFQVEWSAPFRARFAGAPLKSIALTFMNETARGDAIITAYGLEGGAVYALSAPLREALSRGGNAVLQIAMRPDLDSNALAGRLAKPRGKQSLSNWLRRAASLSPVAIGLLREAALAQGTDLAALSPEALARLINAVPVRLTAAAPLARAISSAGGVAFGAIDETFMLTQKPKHFVAGEMLDWEAPTGGYLLQACFASGAAAAQGALRYLGVTVRRRDVRNSR